VKRKGESIVREEEIVIVERKGKIETTAQLVFSLPLSYFCILKTFIFISIYTGRWNPSENLRIRIHIFISSSGFGWCGLLVGRVLCKVLGILFSVS